MSTYDLKRADHGPSAQVGGNIQALALDPTGERLVVAFAPVATDGDAPVLAVFTNAPRSPDLQLQPRYA